MQNWVFLCSLDIHFRKSNCFLFGNQISNWRSFEKRTIFDLLFTLFSYQGKVTKIPSAHISLTYIHVFCVHPIDIFCLTNFEKKNTNLSGMDSDGIKGGMGEFSPPPPPPWEALPPLAPCQKKKWSKSAIFDKFLDFCPLRNAFCPFDAPPQKKIWCRHWVWVFLLCDSWC